MTTVRVRVGKVLTLKRREVVVEPDTYYRLIGVYSFGKGIFHREPRAGAELGNYRFFAVSPGDLVLSNIQAWEGAIALASKRDTGTIGTHRFLTYVPADDCIDANWARWFFLSEPGMALIRKAAPGTTIRNRTLAIDRFEALEIPLPPLAEQRSVAARLDQFASCMRQLDSVRGRSLRVASAVPIALRTQAERHTELTTARLGDVLELVQDRVEIDAEAIYVSIGIRSFGKGLFHYLPRYGDQIGKLRFQAVPPRLLAISNIKAWEGAVATTDEADHGTVASNRFLLFRPVAGEDATDYFYSLLLGGDGIAALQHASPGSADRNRTLAIDRFRRIELRVPSPLDQAVIGRRIREVRAEVARYESLVGRVNTHAEALLPAMLNEAFTSLV